MRLKKLNIFVEGNSLMYYIISVRGSSYVGAESSLRDWVQLWSLLPGFSHYAISR